MGFKYTLTIKNHSSHSDYLMVFQNDPTSWSPDAMALAWFSKLSNPSPTSIVKFSWEIDWGFSWAETGIIQPGIKFEASETADTSGGNKITLDYNGAYFFKDQTTGASPDRLYLSESKNIPVSSLASVGVTMSGNTVYATQARPNQNLTFSPHPTYFLAYGNYEEGQVIDISTVNNPLELRYDTGIYSLETTLNPDDTWDPPKSLASINVQRLKALREEMIPQMR